LLSLYLTATAALPDFGFAFLLAMLLHGFPLLAVFALTQPALLFFALLLLLFALFLGLARRGLALVGHRDLHSQGNIHQNASRISTRIRDQMSRKIQQAISTRTPMKSHRHI
jgi:hypothetical protein